MMIEEYHQSCQELADLVREEKAILGLAKTCLSLPNQQFSTYKKLPEGVTYLGEGYQHSVVNIGTIVNGGEETHIALSVNYLNSYEQYKELSEIYTRIGTFYQIAEQLETETEEPIFSIAPVCVVSAQMGKRQLQGMLTRDITEKRKYELFDKLGCEFTIVRNPEIKGPRKRVVIDPFPDRWGDKTFALGKKHYKDILIHI